MGCTSQTSWHPGSYGERDLAPTGHILFGNVIRSYPKHVLPAHYHGEIMHIGVLLSHSPVEMDKGGPALTTVDAMAVDTVAVGAVAVVRSPTSVETSTELFET